MPGDVSIELRTMWRGLGYYFGLRRRDRLGQVPRIVVVVFNVISIFAGSLEGPRQ